MSASWQHLRKCDAAMLDRARRYGEVVSERLPSSDAWTKVHAREALAAYIAMEGLGKAAGVATLSVASRAAEGSQLLEAQDLAAALARLAAARSAPSGRAEGAIGSQASHSAHEAAAADVAMALQKAMAERVETLKELSSQDLCNALVGLARSPLVLPDAAAAVAGTARGRAAELSPRSLWDFARALAELSAVLQGPQKQQVSSCLEATWPVLASSTEQTLRHELQDDLGLCLAGLARLAAALPPQSEEASSFVSHVLRPNAQGLLNHCQDEELRWLEMAGPLLRLEGQEAWISLLRQLALQSLPGLPRGEEMASRFVSILQWVASCDAQAACPPFFDFAFQELRHRVHELPQADIRRAAELFSQVHLERPDLLPSAASALARAARPPEELPEVALYLSTLAGLYSRVAALPKSEEASSQEERRTALMALAEKLSGGAATVQELLTPSTVAHDATFLALSAFAQAVCRPVDDVPAARELVLQADKLVKLVGKCNPAVEEELRVYIGRFPGEVRSLLASGKQGRDKTEKVKKARKSKKHKKKEKKAGKKKHKKKEKKAGKKQDKKNKKPAEDSQAGDSGDSQQPADVRHDPSPQEAMGEDREIQEAAETQHQLAVSSPPDEVDWGDEDDDADSHHTAAADLGGSDSDTEAAPTAALGTPADLNWPWGERGRPSDRAGLRLFDSLCHTWSTDTEETGEPRFSPQHVHIFITALRSFCVGKGSASPPVSCLEVLQGVVQHTVASAADGDKEARLCLAVLQELATDPACPGSLKAILPGLEANEVHSVQGGEPSGPGGTAQRRLRAAMAASPGSQGAGGFAREGQERGFLRRMFGL
ncbi:hypothetical protein AK812_SmicGene27681 [Symbiodinium microadriaticum]|uniref:Uncharacterized protein n=1 Tax=Symbiodinium microadriaticum TaxID=2951 RepID=A0A1Q9D6F9_SYMMI|nr:hypothetical protein AK812_SmicGene27681 [Symbiodinium microadriaticum]